MFKVWKGMFEASVAPSRKPNIDGAATGRRRAFFCRQRFMSASAVLICTTATISVLRIANTMVLTHLLNPGAFGLIGMILSVFTVINIITDAGFQAFIVRHERGLERNFLDAVWTIHISRGAVNSIIALLLAYPVSWLLSKPELAPLLAVASLTLAIDGTASLSLFTALRQGMVRKLSLVDFTVFCVQLVAGVIAAWFFRSAWAIIFSMLLSSAARVTASYLVFPDARRRLRVDLPLFGELWRFSRMIAASSILTLLISQVDKLLLARVMPLQDFGVYMVAANLSAAPVALVGMYTSRIVYPSVAQVWRAAPVTLGRHYYAIRGLVFYGYLLAAGMLGGGARLVVNILYDSRYQGASIYLRLLAITTAMAMMNKPANETLVASGRVHTTLQVNIVRVLWLAIAMPIGLIWMGPLGGIVVLAMVEIPAYAFTAQKLIRYHLFQPRSEFLAFVTVGMGVVIGMLLAFVAPAGIWRD